MLTLKEPLKLQALEEMPVTGDLLSEKIIGNYAWFGLQLDAADLLHLVHEPTEIFLAEDTHTMLFDSSIQVHQETKLEMLNQLFNRIALYPTDRFTYQDEVFVAAMLQKIGIRNLSFFMKQLSVFQEQTEAGERISSQLLSDRETLRTVWEQARLLYERYRKDAGAAADTVHEAEVRTPIFESAGDDRAGMAAHIFERLASVQLENSIRNYREIGMRGNPGKEEILLSAQQKLYADAITRLETETQMQMLLPVQEAAFYEEELLSVREMNKEAILRQAGAVILSQITRLVWSEEYERRMRLHRRFGEKRLPDPYTTGRSFRVYVQGMNRTADAALARMIENQSTEFVFSAEEGERQRERFRSEFLQIQSRILQLYKEESRILSRVVHIFHSEKSSEHTALMQEQAISLLQLSLAGAAYREFWHAGARKVLQMAPERDRTVQEHLERISLIQHEMDQLGTLRQKLQTQYENVSLTELLHLISETEEAFSAREGQSRTEVHPQRKDAEREALRTWMENRIREAELSKESPEVSEEGTEFLLEFRRLLQEGIEAWQTYETEAPPEYLMQSTQEGSASGYPEMPEKMLRRNIGEMTEEEYAAYLYEVNARNVRIHNRILEQSVRETKKEALQIDPEKARRIGLLALQKSEELQKVLQENQNPRERTLPAAAYVPEEFSPAERQFYEKILSLSEHIPETAERKEAAVPADLSVLPSVLWEEDRMETDKAQDHVYREVPDIEADAQKEKTEQGRRFYLELLKEVQERDFKEARVHITSARNREVILQYLLSEMKKSDFQERASNAVWILSEIREQNPKANSQILDTVLLLLRNDARWLLPGIWRSADKEMPSGELYAGLQTILLQQNEESLNRQTENLIQSVLHLQLDHETEQKMLEFIRVQRKETAFLHASGEMPSGMPVIRNLLRADSEFSVSVRRILSEEAYRQLVQETITNYFAGTISRALLSDVSFRRQMFRALQNEKEESVLLHLMEEMFADIPDQTKLTLEKTEETLREQRRSSAEMISEEIQRAGIRTKIHQETGGWSGEALAEERTLPQSVHPDIQRMAGQIRHLVRSALAGFISKDPELPGMMIGRLRDENGTLQEIRGVQTHTGWLRELLPVLGAEKEVFFRTSEQEISLRLKEADRSPEEIEEELEARLQRRLKKNQTEEIRQVTEQAVQKNVRELRQDRKQVDRDMVRSLLQEQLQMNMHVISEQVYQSLERRLEYEKRRRGY